MHEIFSGLDFLGGRCADNPRYYRVDHSDLYAYEARRQYASEVQRGESGINLAAAALAISAEDDAIVSHSTVKLPEEPFLRRINVFSADVERMTLSHLPSEISPTNVLEVSLP